MGLGWAAFRLRAFERSPRLCYNAAQRGLSFSALLDAKSMQPSLFGLANSNKDFAQKLSWGKNTFNNTFPTALACYMDHLGFEPVYLTLDENLQIVHSKISVAETFGLSPKSPEIFFAFEADFVPYRKLIVGKLPRIDLVTQQRDTCLRGLEIKLTALPDNSTCELKEEHYGCEIVIRQDTIIYLALSLILNCLETGQLDRLKEIVSVGEQIKDWTNTEEILERFSELVMVVNQIALDQLPYQKPIILQPIWKTLGKTPQLHNDALDFFVWSNLAFTRLFLDSMRSLESISRQMRSTAWLVKMLYDFAAQSRFNPKKITDLMTYKVNNDKAFAINGKLTNPYMKCPELSKPRIKKEEIKEIILGGGQRLLSPERRFDALIFYTQAELFN